jgi:hypothetical protein
LKKLKSVCVDKTSPLQSELMSALTDATRFTQEQEDQKQEEGEEEETMPPLPPPNDEFDFTQQLMDALNAGSESPDLL